MRLPRRQLELLFVLDGDGRIVATREPGGGPGPTFALVRDARDTAWAVRAGVAQAEAFARLAREEPPAADPAAPPRHDAAYRALAGEGARVAFGPVFRFPRELAAPDGGVVEIVDEAPLARHFTGWVPGEIAAGRAPALAVLDGDAAVSVCFCARRSDVAAEAGVETAAAYRGRGLAPRVVAAWAAVVRASGREAFYSTSWDNHASLAVARKVGLIAVASDWSVS